MIPSIHEILGMLVRGQCSTTQAEQWLEEHAALDRRRLLVEEHWADLHLHALDYRTAASEHAEEAWQKLRECVLEKARRSLRDDFAGRAMQATLDSLSDNTRYFTGAVLDEYAKKFYAMADAMLRAREGSAT